MDASNHDWHEDWQADRQTGRQADKQTDWLNDLLAALRYVTVHHLFSNSIVPCDEYK